MKYKKTLKGTHDALCVWSPISHEPEISNNELNTNKTDPSEATASVSNCSELV